MSFRSAKEINATIPSTLPAYSAQDLTKGGDQAQIVLSGQIYTLRITRAGKLILTK